MISARERVQLERIRASLGDWALADIKGAASPEVELPRLAFIGLAALLDQLSLLFAKPSKKGKKRPKGLNAWMQFVPRYLPGWATAAERNPLVSREDISQAIAASATGPDGGVFFRGPQR